MAYFLSDKSRSRLTGVDPDLVRVVELALKHTAVDFTVLEGKRSLERQRQLVKQGASQTLKSNHLTGKAVDLGAWVGGKVRWDWPLYYKIADAMMYAAHETQTPIRWGGAWHEPDIGSRYGELKAFDLSNEYVQKRQSEGRKYFLDGPHYELMGKSQKPVIIGEQDSWIDNLFKWFRGL